MYRGLHIITSCGAFFRHHPRFVYVSNLQANKPNDMKFISATPIHLCMLKKKPINVITIESTNATHPLVAKTTDNTTMYNEVNGHE